MRHLHQHGSVATSGVVVGRATNQERNKTFNDEDPRPAGFAPNAVKFDNASGKKTPKSTGSSGS